MNTYLTIFGKPRYLGMTEINDNFVKIPVDCPKLIVIKTHRGLEMGLPGGKIDYEQSIRFRSNAPKFEDSRETMLKDVEFVRVASVDDIERYYELKHAEEKALLYVRNALLNHKLNMKIIDVEYTLDRRRLFCYFVSDKRVDFRMYVRDISRFFHIRIEMRQIGIRDSVRIVKGLASCGRPCCCSYWIHNFMSVSIKMVREQRSALNPIKISGLCGRLMCCMAYEKDCYSELWEKLPGPGSKIKTEQGNYTLEAIEVGNERVNIRFPNGRLVAVPIAEFENFKQTVLNGEEWGEDKELIEKKKAAAERIAAIKERKKLGIKSVIRINAGSFRPKKTETPEEPKQKNKPKIKGRKKRTQKG